MHDLVIVVGDHRELVAHAAHVARTVSRWQTSLLWLLYSSFVHSLAGACTMHVRSDGRQGLEI